MKLGKQLCVISLFALSCCASAAETGEFCTGLGGRYRDALLAEAFTMAFDEHLLTNEQLYENLGPAWKRQLMNDVNEVKPALTKLVAVIVKQVPRWNAEGQNGMLKARKEIFEKLEPLNTAYSIKCVKILQETNIN